MERNGAMAYLKELLVEDLSISPESILIEEQDDSKNVRIRIKVKERGRIKDLAKKHDLKVSEEGECIVISEP